MKESTATPRKSDPTRSKAARLATIERKQARTAKRVIVGGAK